MKSPKNPVKDSLSMILPILVSLAGIVVMAGWIFDIHVLTSINPDWVSMKFITALSFVISGVLAYTMVNPKQMGVFEFLVPTLSFLLLLVMGTFLISIFLYVDTDLGSLFVHERPGAVDTVVPGVPAVPTMVCFILIALAGIIRVYDVRYASSAYWLGAAVVLISGIAVLGYLLSIPFLYFSFAGYTAMAAHTAVLFILLGISMMRCQS